MIEKDKIIDILKNHYGSNIYYFDCAEDILSLIYSKGAPELLPTNRAILVNLKNDNPLRELEDLLNKGYKIVDKYEHGHLIIFIVKR